MDTVGTLEKFHEEGSAQIHPVILSGGAGTRLWPLSRASYPKQLLKLSSQRTMLQDTVARGLIDVGFAAPLLVCNEEHRFLVDDQLQQIGIKPQAILLEPLARNTGPAIAAAAFWLLARDPDALMLIQPADHVIASLADFHNAVMRGLAVLGVRVQCSRYHSGVTLGKGFLGLQNNAYSCDPLRRRRYAPVAVVARVLPQATPQARVRPDDAAGHCGTQPERRRLCRAAAGVQRRSPVSGC